MFRIRSKNGTILSLKLTYRTNYDQFFQLRHLWSKFTSTNFNDIKIKRQKSLTIYDLYFYFISWA